MLKEIKKNIESSLINFIEESKESLNLNKVSPLLYSNLKEFLLRKGKYIRPTLFILAYQSYKKKIQRDNNLFKAALCVELLHDYMLIHDDVIDKSQLRRGKPSLHILLNSSFKTEGQSPGSDLAIVAGDIVFSLAVKALLEIKAPSFLKEKALNKFCQAAGLTALGEFIDVTASLKKIETISEEDIFLKNTLKTAGYSFECPLVLGATLAGAPGKDLQLLSKIGIYAGQAFQIQDDILGIFGTEKTIGKSILTDLNESKKTLLIWKAYNSVAKNDKLLLERILEYKKNNYESLIKIRRIIKKSGAYDYCIDKIKNLLDKANNLILNLNIDRKKRNIINEFINQQFCV